MICDDRTRNTAKTHTAETLVYGASDLAVDNIRDIKQARFGRHAKSAGSPQRTGDWEVRGKAELSNTLSLLAR